jgi:hypothetical protein
MAAVMLLLDTAIDPRSWAPPEAARLPSKNDANRKSVPGEVLV